MSEVVGSTFSVTHGTGISASSRHRRGGPGTEESEGEKESQTQEKLPDRGRLRLSSVRKAGYDCQVLANSSGSADLRRQSVRTPRSG